MIRLFLLVPILLPFYSKGWIAAPGNSGREYRITIEAMESQSTDSTLRVLERRLECFGSEYELTLLSDNEYMLTLQSDIDEKSVRLLTSRGEFGIYALYTPDELGTSLAALGEELSRHIDQVINTQTDAICLRYVPVEQTPGVLAALEGMKEEDLLPAGAILLSTFAIEHNGRLFADFYVAKAPDGSAVIDNSHVSHASGTANHYGTELTISYDSEGAALFSRFTGENTGRQIAVTIDGKILTAPKVYEPIRDGKSAMTGNFTLREAKVLAAILCAGTLPSGVRVELNNL